MSYAENPRLSVCIEWINLGFVERGRTPREIIEKSIRHHLAILSLSNTVIVLEDLGVDRSRIAVHNWVQKADLQPADGESSDRVAVDQKVIRVNDEQCWLYAAVDPETNRILHSRLFPTYTIPIARGFLTELAEKHDVEDALFLVGDADDLIGALRREDYSYLVEQHGFRNSVEHVFREVEHQISSFSNCFSHVDPPTAEAWLQAHTVWWNHA
ncbi:IS6 family transposase [Halorubrum persicum]|uniref:IS6 family transposase n=1 Tax=Halorubrum persicum TaxID=1383844 RepID=A0A2G1WLL6_9EURY|nr:IS6 family transposase [Halorubrum persicum]PHQ39890.1 IS6 family transposase [Halorubrum persicum]